MKVLLNSFHLNDHCLALMDLFFLISFSTEKFMKAVEEDAKERAKIKKRSEAEAEKLKGKGNDAFKEGNYEEAISNYTMAIAKVCTNPVLYTNRAQVNSLLKFWKRSTC